MFDEHTLIFVASKIEISYKAKKACTGQALSRPALYRLVNTGFYFFNWPDFFPGEAKDTPPGSKVLSVKSGESQRPPSNSRGPGTGS